MYGTRTRLAMAQITPNNQRYQTARELAKRVFIPAHVLAVYLLSISVLIPAYLLGYRKYSLDSAYYEY